VVVPTENEDYVEFAPDGTPLGTWHFDPVEETWIFEPSDTPLGSVVKENPVTRERDRAIINTFKVISVIGLSAACLFMFVRRSKRETL
jgi:hypothetical protein